VNFRLRGRPLRTYFVLLVGVFVAAAVAAVAYIHVRAGRDAEHTAEVESRFTARTSARQLGDFMAVLRATVQQLAANPQIGGALDDPAGCTLTFSGIGGPDRGHVDILRSDGTVACSSRAHEAGADLGSYAGQGWLSHAVSGAETSRARRSLS
jgi:hypothetical protein